MRRSLFTIVLLALLLVASVAVAQDEERETVAILDFATSGEIDEAEMRVFVDFMTSHIFGTGRYRVVDRMQRDTLMSEIEFSVSDLSDEEKRLQLGRQLSADKLIVGSLGRIGDRFLLNMKLVDVISGETLNSSSERYNSINDLIDDSEQLALRLMGIDLSEAGTVVTVDPEPDPQPKPEPDPTPKPDPQPSVRRGGSVELTVGMVLGADPNVGATLGYTYQFGNRFSLGAYYGGVMVVGYWISTVGARVILGNKVDGFAVSLNLSDIPGLTMYWRNWMMTVGYAGLFYTDAGRSFYFGQ